MKKCLTGGGGKIIAYLNRHSEFFFFKNYQGRNFIWGY